MGVSKFNSEPSVHSYETPCTPTSLRQDLFHLTKSVYTAAKTTAKRKHVRGNFWERPSNATRGSRAHTRQTDSAQDLFRVCVFSCYNWYTTWYTT